MSVTISSNGPLPSPNSSRREEDLINAFEYEEEHITNSLFSKLEQLRNEKIQLENTLEAESESRVNRLNRQIAALRQALNDQPPHASSPGSRPTRSQSENHPESTTFAGRRQSLTPIRATSQFIPEPSAATIIETLRRENDSLRQRLSDTERDYIRVTRMNDKYREELIQHRSRLGMPVDSLIGLSGSSVSNSPAQSFSQPAHLRRESSASDESGGVPSIHDTHTSEPRRAASPPNRATGATPIPIHPSAPLAAITTTAAPVPMGVPIPRSNSNHQPQRHHAVILSSASSSVSTETSTTTTSPSSSLPPSPFAFSPPTTTLAANFRHGNGRLRTTSDAPYFNEQDQDVSFSNGTHLTTPPSSNNSPFALHLPVMHEHLPLNIPHVNAWGLGPQLSYPSVPPPSLSSSLGSPILSRRNSVHAQHRASSPSPTSSAAPNIQDGNPSEGSRGAHEDNSHATPEPDVNSSTPVSTPNAGTTGISPGSLRRFTSVERGARVAETGSLVPRRRGGGSNGNGRGTWRS